MGDTPHIEQIPKTEQKHVMNSDVEQLYKKLFEDSDVGKRPGKSSTEVGQVGQIESMRLPANWTLGRPPTMCPATACSKSFIRKTIR